MADTKQEQIRSSLYFMPAPSEFAARMRGQMPPRPPQVGAGFALSPEEVSICEEILHEARTHFERLD